MFVTGLQFLPITNEEGPPISSDTEAAVLSISVDNKVCIHSLPQRRKWIYLDTPIWDGLSYHSSLFFRYYSRLACHCLHDCHDIRCVCVVLLFWHLSTTSDATS